MTIAMVRRTCRAVRKGLGKGREQRIERGMGSRLRMGRGKGRRRGKGNGRGRETVKGKGLLNKPQGEMISLMPLLCICRKKCHRQTWTWRAN